MDNDIKKPEPLHHPPQAFVNDPAPVTNTVAPETTPPEPNKERSGWHDFLSFLAILVTAIGIAFLLITFVFRSYQVDGPSMESTLQNNDKLIILKIPRTWAKLTHHQYVPKRGDIIVFTESGLSAYGQDNTKQLIKRVIGLPGERVVVADNHYTVYNAQHPNGFDPDKTLPYNKDGHIPPTTGSVDVTLSKTQLFVSGDNRPDSLDSRSFGPIETNQVIGQLIIRLFPASKISIF